MERGLTEDKETIPVVQAGTGRKGRGTPAHWAAAERAEEATVNR